MAGDVLRTSFEVRLDWAGPAHWADQEDTCRRCQTGTRSRDTRGAIHQSCAERELADRMTDERFGPRGVQLVDERYPQGGTA